LFFPHFKKHRYPGRFNNPALCLPGWIPATNHKAVDESEFEFARDDRPHLMTEITQTIRAIESGDSHAAAQLLPLVYEELRRLAAQRMAQEKPAQTLEPTALVHEAYLRLVGDGQGPHWDHRGHFFAAASEAMRRILVDAARRKQTVRHGGKLHRVSLHDHHQMTQSVDDLLALDDALSRFAAEEPANCNLQRHPYNLQGHP